MAFKVKGDIITANSNAKIIYTGNLLNSDRMYLRYGVNNWTNVNEVQMVKQVDGYTASISVPANASNISFAFFNGKEWDNNYSENYNVNVYPATVYLPEEVTLATEYFSTDFLIAHNVNKAIVEKPEEFSLNGEQKKTLYTETVSNVEKDFCINESGEVNTFGYVREEENLKQKEIHQMVQNFKEEFDIAITNKYAKMFQKEKTYGLLGDEMLFDTLEIEALENPVRIETLESSRLYFKSKEPFVSRFKEAQVQKIQNLIDEIDRALELEKVSAKQHINFVSSVKILPVLKKIANQNLLREQIQEEEKSSHGFLVVTPYTAVNPFDSSLVESVKRYWNLTVDLFKKVTKLVKESFSREIY